MIKVVLDDGAYMPERAHRDDAGYDIRTPIRVIVPPMTEHGGDGAAVIDTGVHVAIPKGFVGFLKSKSGLNVRGGLTGEGVIDAGYTGSIVVKLYNHTKLPYIFEVGDKLIQLVILPVLQDEMVRVAALDDTDRMTDGFGSTGR